MDDSRGLRTGHLVALGGAALALASLWAPWYRVDLDALRQALQQQPGFNGTPLGGFVASIAALLPHSISGDAWQTLHRLDVLVAFASGAAIVALLRGGRQLRHRHPRRARRGGARGGRRRRRLRPVRRPGAS